MTKELNYKCKHSYTPIQLFFLFQQCSFDQVWKIQQIAVSVNTTLVSYIYLQEIALWTL